MRERIRINGVPISEEGFIKYFFEVWDRLEENKTVGPISLMYPSTYSQNGLIHQTKYPDTQLRPAYFRYLTLMAYHVFLSHKVSIVFCPKTILSQDDQVDVTILEVGIGGEYDSTNIVPQPLATGITSLGLDHTLVLGKTLPEIAWQKGGIYKVSRFLYPCRVSQKSTTGRGPGIHCRTARRCNGGPAQAG